MTKFFFINLFKIYLYSTLNFLFQMYLYKQNTEISFVTVDFNNQVPF